MQTLSASLALCARNLSMTGDLRLTKDQSCRDLMTSLFSAWASYWTNNHIAGDLRSYCNAILWFVYYMEPSARILKYLCCCNLWF